MPEKRKLGDRGAVMLVEDPRSHTLIALKSIELNESPEGDRFVEEFEAIARLVHPCVLEIVGYSLAMSNRTAIVGTRFAANGSLKVALEQRRLDDTGKAIVVCGIVLGMWFIHSHGAAHLDLNPSNVLLDEREYAQIGDAWLARLLDLDIVVAKLDSSPFYMSPEMYEEEQGTPADVYSFALILYELLVGQPVLDPEMALGVLMKQVVSGVRPKLPETMDATMRDMIERGWSVDATVRPSFAEIWLRLERIKFQLTGNVSSSQVDEFISWVRRSAPNSIPFCEVVEHSPCGSIRTSSGGGRAAPLPPSGPDVHAPYRGRFAAHEDRVGLWGVSRWPLTRRTGRNARNKRERGRRSG
jgi:serine/threonine protein kinase